MTNKQQRLEEKIERIVELEYDLLDKRLMRDEITQDEYEEESRLIDEWAKMAYMDVS